MQPIVLVAAHAYAQAWLKHIAAACAKHLGVVAGGIRQRRRQCCFHRIQRLAVLVHLRVAQLRLQRLSRLGGKTCLQRQRGQAQLESGGKAGFQFQRTDAAWIM